MKKIIIVDDNRDFIDLLGSVLKDAGYDVLSFHHSSEALAHINKNMTCDMVITDILMPEHDGFDIIDAAKQQSNVKIIAMSGGGTFVSAEKSLEALENSVDACLIKPVRMSELLVVVSKLLEG